MGQTTTKYDIISKLRKDMLVWEGYKPPVTSKVDSIGLGDIEAVFPNGIFPAGAIHEFISGKPEHAAASHGFITCLLNHLMTKGGACLWIGTSGLVFPPALKAFGVDPDRIIFVDLVREKDILWVMEEALKCEGLAAVIAEIKHINFADSRRLQLVTEKSRVTGFIIRTDADRISATPCAARWRITPLPSILGEKMPGVGFPRWNIELLKVKNGYPGSWQVEWSGRFILVAGQAGKPVIKQLKVG